MYSGILGSGGTWETTNSSIEAWVWDSSESGISFRRCIPGHQLRGSSASAPGPSRGPPQGRRRRTKLRYTREHTPENQVTNCVLTPPEPQKGVYQVALGCLEAGTRVSHKHYRSQEHRCTQVNRLKRKTSIKFAIIRHSP